MVPTRTQFRKWSLPAKCSYVGAVIGIPLAVLSILLGALTTLWPDPQQVKTRSLVFRVAQELRYNSNWLRDVLVATESGDISFPSGFIRTEGLIHLMEQEHDKATQWSYGEEKYIYQHALHLNTLGNALGIVRTKEDLLRFYANSEHNLADTIFLNDFLRWYLAPLFEDTLNTRQVSSLGWGAFGYDRFRVEDVNGTDRRCFFDGQKPVVEFSHYLGLID